MTRDPDRPSLAELVSGAGGPLLPDGVPPLRTLYLYIAGSCNLACRHCWITPGFDPKGSKGPFVPVEYVEKAIREGRELGLISAKLTGGEPTLHPEFRRICEFLAAERIGTVMETNGTLIDDDLATFLAGLSIMGFISVSLDGARAESHDGLREVAGSFERAIRGIEALRRAGYRPQIICTLHRGNVEEMDEVIALAQHLGCSSVKFNHVQSLGRGEHFDEDRVLAVEDIIALESRIAQNRTAAGDFRVFFDIPFAFRGIKRLLSESTAACGILNILGMLATGQLAMCGIGVNVPELVYGHIAEDSLGDVWCSSPGLQRLRQLVPAHLDGICADCVHRDLCLGTCVANSYHATGRINAAYGFCAAAEALGLFPAGRRRVAREGEVSRDE